MTPQPQSLVCLTTSAAFGGAETSLLTLLAAMRKLEPSWAITVIVPTDGALVDACRRLGIETVVLPYPPALAALGESGATGARRRSIEQLRLVRHAAAAAIALPAYVSELRTTLRRVGATVVHTNGLKAHVAGALAVSPGMRLVWHLHEYVHARPLTARLLRLFVRRVDAIVTNSDSVLRDAGDALGVESRCRRIYNAVDSAVFRADGPALDLASLAGMPPDDGRVRVGLIATFGRWKGHDVFIDALARLNDRSALRAYIVGGAVYETSGSQWSDAELRTLVAARGLADAIGFTGHVTDVPSALRALDVVVHASTQPEPFGMVIAEAMAAGRAVIAVRAGGAMELFEDRKTALGFPIGDPAQLAAGIRELAADAELRASLGARARTIARETFAPDRMAAEFREVYLG